MAEQGDSLAPYACDHCRSRKVACSRDRSGCQRCKADNETCLYSRSGVIRRNKKRKHGSMLIDGHNGSPSVDGPKADFPDSHPSGSDGTELQSQLATDIDATRERLRGSSLTEQGSFSALSSLSEAYAAVWHDASGIDKAAKNFFLFEDHDVSWVNAFVAGLERGRPLMTAAPPEVLNHLRASRPHLVQERAWLVMYYSIILSMVSSTTPEDESTKMKLRSNLWLAFNDVRLLLEPSEANIQALVLLACHVEEFTTPSLCWLLVTTACRMLQALGIRHRRLDSETRERRTMMFWHLHIIDQGLALVFCRPPTFHRAMAREIDIPTLDKLLPFQPHRTSPGAPSLFGAHFLHQLLLLSRITADIWHCLYEETPNERSLRAASEALDSWHRQATKVLKATALAEKPFLNADGAATIDLGIRTVDFGYYYHAILLARSCSQMKKQAIESSKRMLSLLPEMVSDSEEPYNGIVWQLLCSPFTPFLTLFGEILSDGATKLEAKRHALAAMEHLPVFLGKMSLRNTLAKKLERIAVVIVQHARSMVYPQAPRPNTTTSMSVRLETPPNLVSSTGESSTWDEASPLWTFNHGPMTDASMKAQGDGLDAESLEDLATWTNNFFVDGVLDWVEWDNFT